MTDTLASIKKRLNLDQRNLVSATVLDIGASTARVRLSSGEERTVYFAESLDIATGDLVQVSRTGRTASIQGSANLTQPGGEKIIILS